MKISTVVLSLLLVSIGSCNEETYSPKPRGYFRIGLPAKEYQTLTNNCPYQFEFNSTAQWEAHSKDCWGDIFYPSLKGKLQLTYKSTSADKLETLLNEGRSLAYKHTVKADGISERVFSNSKTGVHGIFYKVLGEAATSQQFFMTDSNQHFLRGVLYFHAEPNEDSLQPANNFLEEEIVHLIETLEWKED